MDTIGYRFKLSYLWRSNGSLFPGLAVQLQNVLTGIKTIEIDAELDSGAEYSLFDGSLLSVIGLDLFDGSSVVFRLNNGLSLDSRILEVVILHDQLGRFPLHLRFSTGPLNSNILGRDFFDLLPIGFDEHQSAVYLGTPR